MYVVLVIFVGVADVSGGSAVVVVAVYHLCCSVVVGYVSCAAVYVALVVGVVVIEDVDCCFVVFC